MVSNAEAENGFASTVSTYATGDGSLVPLDIVPTGTSNACWIVITNDTRHTYTTGPLDHSVGHLSIDRRGRLTVEGVDFTPHFALDEALSRDSRYLYVLNPEVDVATLGFGDGHVSLFEVHRDGSTTLIETFDGVPGSSSGLAAW